MVGEVLIERVAERAELDTVLDEAVAGRGALVLLTGEAGVGKTRLVEEVATAADVRLLGGASGSRRRTSRDASGVKKPAQAPIGKMGAAGFEPAGMRVV